MRRGVGTSRQRMAPGAGPPTLPRSARVTVSAGDHSVRAFGMALPGELARGFSGRAGSGGAGQSRPAFPFGGRLGLSWPGRGESWSGSPAIVDRPSQSRLALLAILAVSPSGSPSASPPLQPIALFPSHPVSPVAAPDPPRRAPVSARPPASDVPRRSCAAGSALHITIACREPRGLPPLRFARDGEGLEEHSASPPRSDIEDQHRVVQRGERRGESLEVALSSWHRARRRPPRGWLMD